MRGSPLFKIGLRKSRCVVCGKSFMVDVTELAEMVTSPSEATYTLRITVPPDDRLDHAECIAIVEAARLR